MTEEVGYTIKELEESLLVNVGNGRRHQALSLLISAINDWPTPILTTNKYVEEIAILVGSVPNFDNVSSVLNQMNMSQDAWKAESLFQLSELFQLYPDAHSLQELISDLLKQP